MNAIKKTSQELIFIDVFVSIFALQIFFIKTLNAQNQVLNIQDSYKEFCAGCHGFKMEKFRKDQWLYGNSVTEIAASIKHGRSVVGMPSFEVTFTDDEIMELAGFIKESTVKPIDETKLLQDKNLDQRYNIEQVIEGLNVPWGMVWLSNNDLLVTEREGKILRFTNYKPNGELTGVPDVYAYGQGGLLDIEKHPDYNKNGWIYISYSYPAEDGEDAANPAIMRFKLKGNNMVNKEIIFKGTPLVKRGPHFGSRIEFGNDGKLYFSIGERGQSQNAQTLTNHSGKVHRINDDGSIPSDNPFINTEGAMPTIYSYGHRNIQGLAKNPLTGEIWSNEHGPKGGDEINIEFAGKNYGWPVITYGINYNGTIITNETQKEGMEQPVTYYVPSIAPCGMEFITSHLYPSWINNILIGSLKFQYLEMVTIEDNTVIKKERLAENIGRVRNVKQGPDGYIYFATEKPGIIFRLLPGKL